MPSLHDRLHTAYPRVDPGGADPEAGRYNVDMEWPDPRWHDSADDLTLVDRLVAGECTPDEMARELGVRLVDLAARLSKPHVLEAFQNIATLRGCFRDAALERMRTQAMHSLQCLATEHEGERNESPLAYARRLETMRRASVDILRLRNDLPPHLPHRREAPVLSATTTTIRVGAANGSSGGRLEASNGSRGESVSAPVAHGQTSLPIAPEGDDHETPALPPAAPTKLDTFYAALGAAMKPREEAEAIERELKSQDAAPVMPAAPAAPVARASRPGGANAVESVGEARQPEGVATEDQPVGTSTHSTEDFGNEDRPVGASTHPTRGVERDDEPVIATHPTSDPVHAAPSARSARPP